MVKRITLPYSQSEIEAALDWRRPSHRTGNYSGLSSLYNVAPGRYPTVFHRFNEERYDSDSVRWGFLPPALEERGFALVANVGIKKAMTGRYLRHMWMAGRAIVPLGGWYEWAKVDGEYGPWYVRPKDGGPAFAAVITNYRPFKSVEGAGFTFIAAADESGVVDPKDRRPVVLSAADAHRWAEPIWTEDAARAAERLARGMALPKSAFEAYRVSKNVNLLAEDDERMTWPIAKVGDSGGGQEEIS